MATAPLPTPLSCCSKARIDERPVVACRSLPTHHWERRQVAHRYCQAVERASHVVLLGCKAASVLDCHQPGARFSSMGCADPRQQRADFHMLFRVCGSENFHPGRIGARQPRAFLRQPPSGGWHGAGRSGIAGTVARGDWTNKASRKKQDRGRDYYQTNDGHPTNWTMSSRATGQSRLSSWKWPAWKLTVAKICTWPTASRSEVVLRPSRFR